MFYSPGYHATKLNATAYGTRLDRVLDEWRRMLDGHGAPMPEMHLMLNIMPAPWLSSQKHTLDRKHQTLLNEHQANLAIIDAAARFDFVQSVVNVFSIKLPFNGYPGHTVHMDVVHVGDKRVLRIAVDHILNTFCRTINTDPIV